MPIDSKFAPLVTLFGLREVEATVLDTLLRTGETSASAIAGHASISRPSAYDVLNSLVAKGLAYETIERGVKIFGLQSAQKIKLLVEQKADLIHQAGKALHLLEQTPSARENALKPRLQVFEGRTELQQMMKDMLLYRDVTVYAHWPVAQVIEVLGEDFLRRFHTERIRRNISIKALWAPQEARSVQRLAFMGAGPTLKREVRIAPPGVSFALGYAVYGTTVRFISSTRENFGFLIQSGELADLMKGLFLSLWNISKPID